MNTINTQVVTQLVNKTAHTLVRRELCTPRQAVAAAMVLGDNIEKLLSGSSMTSMFIEAEYEETLVNGVLVDPVDVLYILTEAKMIANLLDTGVYVAGQSLLDILDHIKQGYAPIEESKGFVRYGVSEMHKRTLHTDGSCKLMMDAIGVLEDTEFQRSEYMLDIVLRVQELAPEHKKIVTNEYVISGTSEMKAGIPYVSEFMDDARGRMYQACCYGPNGQSSDLARALMDFSDVSTGYDIKDAIAHITLEMKDMGHWADKPAFIADFIDARDNPVEFIIKHLDKQHNIMKPWNFVKFSNILAELLVGNRPYIGVAIGKDCKSSCAQIGGLLVADEKLLMRCGFTTKDIDDSYINVIAESKLLGIQGLTRSMVKKPFMAVLYGVAIGGLMDAHTIQQECWDVLYTGLDAEEIEALAAKFFKAITNSFGLKLNNLRKKIKEAGMIYGIGEEPNICKYDKPVHYRLPDGFEVEMDYRVMVDIDDERIHGKATDVKVEGNMSERMFNNLKFTTNELDLASHARTGFVNMVQAVDGLLARLIIVYANSLGAQHIVSVHDCFRVNIHDAEILDEAIKMAYHELFGTEYNQETMYLPLGTDILGMYFEGTVRSTKDEYLNDTKRGSQFYGKSNIRRLMEVDGVSIKDSINDLGNTKYFDK